MTEETSITMKPEEAIIEIRSLQLKHNQDIKNLQEDFNKVTEKFTFHVKSTTNQIENGLRNIKQDMGEVIGENIQKLRDENSNHWASVIQEMKAIKESVAHPKTERQTEERIPLLDNRNSTEFSVPSKQAQQDRDIPSPTLNMDTVSIHTNPADGNNQKTQMIILPPPAAIPVFHGRSTEGPWKFLIRVEEYTETVHMWTEDTLLRGISQFLKDTALDWYCQLRSCHSLPKTWREFKQVFLRQFNSPLRMAQQQQQWKQCKQGNEETINEFIVRLRALWVEQFPHETEQDLIKHLFCKMRPDILNIMGCPRNTSLQEIILEAQRVEEILYYRTKQQYDGNKWSTNSNYFSDNMNNKNINSMNKNHDQSQRDDQTYNNTKNSTSYQQMQRNHTGQQKPSCYNCGKFNHKTRDCWYQSGNNNNYSHQSTSFSKNE
jgi:hypothetical protein